MTSVEKIKRESDAKLLIRKLNQDRKIREKKMLIIQKEMNKKTLIDKQKQEELDDKLKQDLEVQRQEKKNKIEMK